jgi:hypothetical protein
MDYTGFVASPGCASRIIACSRDSLPDFNEGFGPEQTAGRAKARNRQAGLLVLG